MSLARATTQGQRCHVTPEPLLLTTPAQKTAGDSGVRSEMQPYPVGVLTTASSSVIQ